jgi:hypothetical protein
VLPARELLADLLLELNQPAAALVEYRAMLSTDPNRHEEGEGRFLSDAPCLLLGATGSECLA